MTNAAILLGVIAAAFVAGVLFDRLVYPQSFGRGYAEIHYGVTISKDGKSE